MSVYQCHDSNLNQNMFPAETLNQNRIAEVFCLNYRNIIHVTTLQNHNRCYNATAQQQQKPTRACLT